MQTVNKWSFAVLGTLLVLATGCAAGDDSPTTTRVAAEQVGPHDPASHADVQTSKPTLGGGGSTQITAAQPGAAPPPSNTATATHTYTYSVASNGPVHSDLEEFSRLVASTLADPRGWADGGRVSFRQVAQ